MQKYMSVTHQINNLSRNGMLFSDINQNDAKDLLTNEVYYHKVISYKHYFSVYKTKKNVDYFNGLDFLDLYEYYKIDNLIRQALNLISIDVEDYFKVYIMRHAEQNRNVVDPAYFYYEVMDIEKRFTPSSKMQKRIRDYDDIYSKKMLRKFPDKKPTWVLNEYLTFGEVCEIYAKYIQDNHLKWYQYDVDILYTCKNVRNLCVHGNKLFVNGYNKYEDYDVLVSLFKSVLGVDLSKKHVNNHFKYNILATLYSLYVFCPKEIYSQKIDEFYKLLHSIIKKYSVIGKYPDESVVCDIKLICEVVDLMY